jgi:uncharacterized membrane protein
MLQMRWKHYSKLGYVNLRPAPHRQSFIPKQVKPMKIVTIILKYFLTLVMVAAGVNHFLNPAFYVRIMPPYLPWHLELVYLSGVFEILFGVLLLVPRFMKLAAWGLIALLIAIFPANLHMAINSDLYTEVPPVALWLRLHFQGVFIAWAYWFTRPDRGSVEVD